MEATGSCGDCGRLVVGMVEMGRWLVAMVVGTDSRLTRVKVVVHFKTKLGEVMVQWHWSPNQKRY